MFKKLIEFGDLESYLVNLDWRKLNTTAFEEQTSETSHVPICNTRDAPYNYQVTKIKISQGRVTAVHKVRPTSRGWGVGGRPARVQIVGILDTIN